MMKQVYPVELLEDLKKEFPEASIEELMAKADVRIAAEEALPATEPISTGLL
jgi:hypothetical protein